jgi:hypothetical protein
MNTYTMVGLILINFKKNCRKLPFFPNRRKKNSGQAIACSTNSYGQSVLVTTP